VAASQALPSRPAPWWRRFVAGGVGRAELPAAEPLLAAHRRHHPKADFTLLRRAYLAADHLHSGQWRKSGAPYISHPLSVATILAEMGMDTITLVAGLLHDTVEDTPYTLGQVYGDFGEEVAILVDGVTKLDGAKWGDRAAAETFRKMILASATDLRVLVIKLADRLHNLRTLRFQPRHKQERIARASLELLVPFAERLGVHVLKREMDDLCFASLEPDVYTAAAAAVSEVEPAHHDYFARAGDQLAAELAAARLDAEVVIRRRHLYSIHLDRDGDLTGLVPGDTTRLLVVVDGDDRDCYIALGAVHGLWHPVPGRLKDYIAAPRHNMYRALHTSVIGPDGAVLDLFVRTREGHRVAEYGLVAHVADAASAADRRAVTRRSDLEWLRRLLNWQGQAGAAEFLDSLRIDLGPGSIITFTPSGQMVPLPPGATPIDLAYALSADIGNHCVGALVNGRLIPLSATLVDGNVVEVLTADGGSPSADWLEFAKTAQARVQIAQWLAERRDEQAASAGRRLLAAELDAQGVDLFEAEGNGAAMAAARRLGHRDLDALYAAVVAEQVDLGDLAKAIADDP
jgi:RelA/SpoT family (p)ppGpp synthetase